MSQSNAIEQTLKRGRGRPRIYATEEEYKEKSKQKVIKYNKEHAEKIRLQNKENYIRKNYLDKQVRGKYNTAYSEMYGTTAISI